MSTGRLALLDDPRLREWLHAVFAWVERIRSSYRYGPAYIDRVRRLLPLDFQNAITNQCGQTWEWQACDPDVDVWGLDEVLRTVAADSELQGSYRVHGRELWVFRRDLRAALDIIDRFEGYYLR